MGRDRKYPSNADRQRAYRDRKHQEQAAVKAAVQLGPCTLWQADCLQVFRAGLLPAHSVDLVVADLPYGVTACAWDCVLPLGELWAAYKRLLTPNGVVVLTAAEGFDLTLYQSNPAWYRYKFVWRKNNISNPMLVASQPGRIHEYLLVFAKGRIPYTPQMTTGHKPVKGFRDDTKLLGEVYRGSTRGTTRLIATHRDNPDGTRYPTTVWDIPLDRANVHPTAKPVELLRRLVLTYSQAGATVLDNTMGSGTAALACVQTGRRFYGIELEEGYFKTACQRVEQELQQLPLFA
jgi:site-specific DNA-methyltransferase (adenine-specific)